MEIEDCMVEFIGKNERTLNIDDGWSKSHLGQRSHRQHPRYRPYCARLSSTIRRRRKTTKGNTSPASLAPLINTAVGETSSVKETSLVPERTSVPVSHLKTSEEPEDTLAKMKAQPSKAPTPVHILLDYGGPDFGKARKKTLEVQLPVEREITVTLDGVSSRRSFVQPASWPPAFIHWNFRESAILGDDFNNESVDLPSEDQASVLATSTSYPLVPGEPSVDVAPASHSLAKAMEKLRLRPQEVTCDTRRNPVSEEAPNSSPLQHVQVKQENAVTATSLPFGVKFPPSILRMAMQPFPSYYKPPVWKTQTTPEAQFQPKDEYAITVDGISSTIKYKKPASWPLAYIHWSFRDSPSLDDILNDVSVDLPSEIQSPVFATSTSYPRIPGETSVNVTPAAHALAKAMKKLKLGPKEVNRRPRHNQVSQEALKPALFQDTEVTQEKPVEVTLSRKVSGPSPCKVEVMESTKPAPLLHVDVHALLELPLGISSLPKVSVPVLETSKPAPPQADAEVNQAPPVNVPSSPEITVHPPSKPSAPAVSELFSSRNADQEQPVHFPLPPKVAGSSSFKADVARTLRQAPSQTDTIVKQEKPIKVISSASLTAGVPAPAKSLPLPKTKPFQSAERRSPPKARSHSQPPILVLQGGARANISPGLTVTIQRPHSAYHQVARHDEENWGPRNADLEQGPADPSHVQPPASSPTKSVLETLRNWVSPAWWGSR
jgi:hypothetical protein